MASTTTLCTSSRRLKVNVSKLVTVNRHANRPVSAFGMSKRESGVIEKPQDRKGPALALPKNPVSREEKASDRAGTKSPPLGSVCAHTVHTAPPK